VVATAAQPAPLGIAIVGCGRIAGSHAAAIAALPALGRLVAVADPDLDRARQLAAKHGDAAPCRDLAQVLARPDVDAVLICTPNALHAAQSVEAMESGRHVLVEKPMAEDADSAGRMAAVAERTGRVLVVGQTLRHTTPIRYFQDHRRDYGRLRAVEVSMCVRWDGPQAPWWRTRTRREGLILSLFAPHALDFVQLAFAGEQPVNVHAEAGRFQDDWLAEDEAMMLLRYPGGRLASVHISYNQRFVVDRRTLHFEDAMVRIEHGDFLWVDDRLLVQPPPGDGGDARHRMGRDLGLYFRTQFEEFVRAVRGEPHRSVLHAEGLHLTRLVDRVIESALRNAAQL
jgi:predicted dehydrogenase